MKRIDFRIIIVLSLIIASSILLGFSFLPLSNYKETISPFDLGRSITIQYPEYLKLGEVGQVKVGISADDQENPGRTRKPNFETAKSVGQERNELNIETRLDMPNVKMEPAGTLSSALVEQSQLKFSWQLKPFEKGNYSGTVWIYLIEISRDNEPSHKQLLLTKPIQIDVISILGLPLYMIKIFGFLMLGLTLIAGYPFIKKMKVHFDKNITK